MAREEDLQRFERSLAATLAQAAVTGVTAGGANVIGQQIVGAIKKPKAEEPPPSKKS